MFNRSAVVATLLLACGTKSPHTSTTSQASEPLSNTVAADASTAVEAPPAPPSSVALRLTRVDPELGDTAGGTYVVIKGEGFMKDGPRNVKVYFGGVQGTVVRFQSDSELIVQAPGGKTNEMVDIRVIFDPGGEMLLRNAFKFVDKQPASP